MKKIFYKIFVILLIITYFPLVLLYSFHGFYMKKYVENRKIAELKRIIRTIDDTNLKFFTKEFKERLEKKKDIKIQIIDEDKEKVKSEIFEYLSKKFWKIDLKNLKRNETSIRFEKESNLLNRVHIIKKISKNKYIVISSLMVVPEVIYKIILSSYFYVTPFLLIIMLILSYLISKKMAVPIEVLEDVSTRVLNLDFSKSIGFKGNDELTVLGNNITSMAMNLKKKNDELKKLNEKLKYELERNKKFIKFEKEFINSISHELKTPIAIINGYIEVLQDKIIENKEDIEKIYLVMYNEGIYLDKMIKDLNSYHSYEHEFFAVKKEKINFKEFFNRILNKYLLDIKEKNINLKVNIEEKIIEEDLKKLDVVLNNLVTNAITYSDDRGILNIDFKDNSFIIENSCEYISEEKMENIFKPFYKSDFSRKRKYGGTGLGLSIVKNILEVLQLFYEVKFDEERSCFIFKIRFN